MTNKHIIIKRDARRDIFDPDKLYEKINRARLDANESFEGVEEKLKSVVLCVEQTLPPEMEVEKLHQVVEQTLYSEGLFDTARAYSDYRQSRDYNREMKSDLMKTVSAIGVETDRDNANVGGNFSAKMLRIASETNKIRNLGSMPKRFARAHEVGDFYIHDLDSYNLTLNCIAGTEYGLFKDLDGNTYWTTFSSLNKYFGDKDIVINPDIYVQGRLGWTKVKAMSRRKLNEGEKLYHLKTRRGMGIKATGEHRIPVIRDGEEVLLEVKDIKVGDRLIKASVEENPLTEIPVLDLLVANIDKITYGVTIQNCSKLLDWLKFRYGDEFVFKRTTGQRASCKGTGLLSAEEYTEISNKFYVPYEVKKELSITVTKEKKSIPAYLPVTPAFCRLLGYLLAEGHIQVNNDRVINIANINRKILDDIEQCVYEVFNDTCTEVRDKTVNNRVKGININGSIYVTLFELLGVKKNAANIDIPSFILEGNDEIKENFIFGLFEGDGSYGKMFLTYATVCENYAKKLVMLFDSLGIESTLRKSKTTGQPVTLNGKVAGKRNYDTYYIKINDVNSMRTFLKRIGSFKRDERIEHYVAKATSANKIGEEITSILVQDNYTDYVYDLETAEHWFICNNYVVHNCLHIPLGKALAETFNTGYGTLNTPQRIETAAELSCILLQSTQNDMFGGQSHPNFANDLAPYLEATEQEIARQVLGGLL